MRSLDCLKAVTIAAVGLLCAPLLWELRPQPFVQPSSHSLSRVPIWSPSTAALVEAKQIWIQAWHAAGKEQSQLEGWDPAAAAAGSFQSWEQAEVTRRPELGLAHQSAQRALALAQSQPEMYRSVRWLARIECALGRHGEELQRARQLVSLSPGDEGSLTCLLQAAKCNGLTELEQQAFAALKRRRSAPAAGGGPPASSHSSGSADAVDRGATASGSAGRGGQRE